FFAAFLSAVLCLSASGQERAAATVTIELSANNTVKISGRFTDPDLRSRPRNLSFELSAAGFNDIAANIKDLELFDAAGEKISYRTLVPGEYLAERDIAAWRYSKDISPRKERYAAAHISWRNSDLAVLMTADLLPQTTGSVEV